MKDKSVSLPWFCQPPFVPSENGFWNKDYRVLAFGISSNSHVFYLSECERVIMLQMEIAGIQLKLQCRVFNVYLIPPTVFIDP